MLFMLSIYRCKQKEVASTYHCIYSIIVRIIINILCKVITNVLFSFFILCASILRISIYYRECHKFVINVNSKKREFLKLPVINDLS